MSRLFLFTARTLLLLTRVLSFRIENQTVQMIMDDTTTTLGPIQLPVYTNISFLNHSLPSCECSFHHSDHSSSSLLQKRGYGVAKDIGKLWPVVKIPYFFLRNVSDYFAQNTKKGERDSTQGRCFNTIPCTTELSYTT